MIGSDLIGEVTGSEVIGEIEGDNVGAAMVGDTDDGDTAPRVRGFWDADGEAVDAAVGEVVGEQVIAHRHHVFILVMQ